MKKKQLDEMIDKMVKAQMGKKEMLKEENKNSLDNRLYIALQDLARLSSYLSDPKKPITNQEVNKFRNELAMRYKMVDDYIGKYASK